MKTHRETIQEYLSRGGTITTCAPHTPHTGTGSSYPPTPARVGGGEPEQARSNASWARYLAQLITDDKLGAYCSFSLTTPASLEVIKPLLYRRCLTATNLHNPTPRRQLNRTELEKWSRSQLAHRGTMVFLLPSTSAAGLYHFHGLVRTPREFCDALLPMKHYREGKREEVMVPQEVDFVFGVRRDKGNDLLRNINITTPRNAPSTPCQAVLLHEDEPARTNVLAYYQKTEDGEVRDFTQAVFIPHIIRKALPNANTTKERRVA